MKPDRTSHASSYLRLNAGSVQPSRSQRAGRLARLACLVGCLLGPSGTQAGLLWNPFFPGHGVATPTSAASVEVPLGFPLDTPLGFTFSTVFLNEDGHLTFDEPFARSLGTNNLQRFYRGSFGARVELEIIAPFWTDLDLATHGTVTYGNPSPNVFVASWVEAACAGSTNRATFQVAIIRPGAGHFVATEVGGPGSPNQSADSRSILFAYGQVGMPPGLVSVGLAGSFFEYLKSVPDAANSQGVLTNLANLVGPADPWLFNRTTSSRIAEGISFSALTLVPLEITRAGGETLISWPVAGASLVLERATVPRNPSAWTPAPWPQNVGSTVVVTVPRAESGASQFFRLRE